MSGGQNPNMLWLLTDDVKNEIQIPTNNNLTEEREKWYSGECTGGLIQKDNRGFPVMTATSVPKEYFNECRDALNFVYEKVQDDDERLQIFQTFCEKNQKFVQIVLSQSPGEFPDDVEGGN